MAYDVQPGTGGRKVGVAIVGLGGAVATTLAAGLDLLGKGAVGREGLPLGEYPDGAFGLAGYDAIEVAGWDLDPRDLAAAARHHGVVSDSLLKVAETALSDMRPWAARGDRDYCRNIEGGNLVDANSKRATIQRLKDDLRRFREERGLDGLVVLNLASTERKVDEDHEDYATIDAFEDALDRDADTIGPAMLYAYAAISEGMPYGNFTPSVGAEIPALIALAEQTGAPLAGRDGKTGQTLMKTILAPAVRARALKVEGWYSTNILGNGDGKALDDPASLGSKLSTKGDVLDQMLGYRVKDHIVQISYYPPRGDDKEAWDNIDVSGFLGERMQVKLNFLCKDSILAAPLAIEIVRCLDLAKRRHEAGPIDALATFFKAPLVSEGEAVHAFGEQHATFLSWLAEGPVPSPAATSGEVVKALATAAE